MQPDGIRMLCLVPQSCYENHSLSWQIVTLCVCAWRSDWVRSASKMASRAVYNVEEVYLLPPCWSVSETINSPSSVLWLTLTSGLPVEKSIWKPDFPCREPYIDSVSQPRVKIGLHRWGCVMLKVPVRRWKEQQINALKGLSDDKNTAQYGLSFSQTGFYNSGSNYFIFCHDDHEANSGNTSEFLILASLPLD